MKVENEDHPIEKIMASAMEKIKTLVDVNTVVGEPITMPDGTMILPVSKVSMGFVAGGGEYSDISINAKKNDNYPFAGGSGAGFCISPVGFVSFKDGIFKMSSTEMSSVYEKIIENIPPTIKAVMEKINTKKEK